MKGADLMMHEGETIERAAMEALHALLDPELARRLNASLVAVADSAVSIAGALPASAITINRVLGLGLERPVADEDLARITALYDETGVERYFVQIHPDARSDAFLSACERLGLARARGWQKFSRGGAEPLPEVRTEFVIREIGPEHGEVFGRIVCDAFDLGETAIPWIARLPGRNGWRAFMAFDGESPAGAGGLYVKDSVAFTDFGATVPAFRGRGAQSANLAHRVRFALEAGARRIYTCTGEEVPGDPQHSYRNIKKMGFQEDYLRENYGPPKG